MDSSHIAWNCLRLVYPPVSSLDAEPLVADKQVEAVLERSKFYLIGKRPQIFFGEPIVKNKGSNIALTLQMTREDGSVVEDCVEIDLKKLPKARRHHAAACLSMSTNKILVIDDAEEVDDEEDPTEPLNWFTTEKLLYDRWRGTPGISGLHRLREFTTYELLYVGISKKNNTSKRLFSGSHEARQRVLNNEFAAYGGGRISEEIYLFAFDIEPLSVRTLALTDQLTGDPGGPAELDKIAVVADAEKAFIDLLDAEYNRVKYKNYPVGEDGLYAAGLSGYSYQFAEDITFVAKKGTFRGDRDPLSGYPSNRACALVIHGDLTTVFDPLAGHEDDECSAD